MTTILKLTTYKLKLNDPRVRKRVLFVLSWCDQFRLSKQARPVHHEELGKVFVSTSRGLGQYLYANLLTKSGHYIPGKQSFSYKLNLSGYEKLYRMLECQPPADKEIAQTKFGEIINGTEVPVYKDNGDRRFHPIQNLKREIRKQAFAGWWDYDIESCAPTLVYQYAMQHYRFLKRNENIKDPFPTIVRYMNEKAAIRSHVASLVGLDEQETKRILNALLFQANIAPSPKAKVFQSLGCNRIRHQRLICDPFIKDFRSEVKAMWRMARAHDNYQNMKLLFDGKIRNRKPAKASDHRMAIYLRLERQVMDAILDQLSSASPKILMHDGFMSMQKVSPTEVAQIVLEKTGFIIRLSERQYGTVSGSDVSLDERFDVQREKTQDEANKPYTDEEDKGSLCRIIKDDGNEQKISMYNNIKTLWSARLSHTQMRRKGAV